MRFKDIYYEATIIHEPSESDRVILTRPTVIPLPEELMGKRLVTIVNSDASYFTFVFDKDAKDPMALIVGNSSNPRPDNSTHVDVNVAKRFYDKHFTPFAKGNIESYKGEARIHPPFDGYVEFPQDVSAPFFTDFDNADAVYKSGDTLADKYTKIK